jgi:hypothetical protein
MGTLTKLDANATVHRNDVVAAVLIETSLSIDAHGTDTVGRSNVEVWIGQAFNKILRKREGLGDLPKRNYWSLTVEGVKAAAILLGQTVPELQVTTPEVVEPVAVEPTPEPETVSEPEPVVQPPATNEGGGGVSWAAMGTQVNTYNADPYIRGLAIAQTACFGEYSDTSKICEDCPLSGACKSQVLSKVSDIAARLTRRDADAVAAAQRASQMPLQPEPLEEEDDDEDVDDIVSMIEDDDDAEDTVDVPENAELGNGFRAIRVPGDAVCRACQKDLVIGSLVAWKRGAGMYHLNCDRTGA